ncbi:MAG: DUF5693 family protein [bacterium]
MKQAAIAAFALALLLALPILYQRYRVETQDKGVRLVIDFNDFSSQAAREGVTFEQFGAAISELGATLAVSETRFKDFVADSSVHVEATSSGINFTSSNEAAANRLGEALRFHFAPDSYGPIPGGWHYKGRMADLDETGGSFDWDPVNQLRQMGIPLVLRPYNSKLATPAGLADLLAAIQDVTGTQSVLIAEGDEVLGYPSTENYKAVHSEWTGYFGAVEFSEQKGLNQLLALDLSRDIRVHSISDRELPVYSPNRALARYLRAVRERKLQILYLNALPGFSFTENIQFARQLRDQVKGDGFRLDVMTTAEYEPNGMLLAALTTAIVLIFTLFAWRQPWPAPVRLLLIAAAAVLGAFDIARASIAVKSVFVVLTAGVLPFFFLRECWNGTRLNWLRLTVMNYALGLVLGAFLTTTPLLRGVASLSGIKLALLLPSALTFAWALSPAFSIADLKRITLNAWNLAWIFAALAAAAYIVIRSGNVTGLAIPGEEHVRELLEKWLPVRPRTKELAGHPVLLFMGTKERTHGNIVYGLWLAFGMLAQATLVNSFFHLHTPLEMTMMRSLLGILFGLALGWAVIWIERTYGRAAGRLFRGR